ncbi:MAG: flippase [Lachnospiraceae bacterium]|nr:flippase [Lachnospiraceae bacterium]
MKEKSLVKNSIYNVVYKFVNVIYPLITTMYISHIFLADGVGKIASMQNIVQYFVMFASLGIPSYGIREIAKVRNNPEELNGIYSELLLINAVATTACIVAFYSMVFCFDYFETNRSYYCVLGLNIVLNYLNIDWLFQGIEEYYYITKRNIIVKLTLLILIFVCIRDKDDLFLYLLLIVFATAGNYIFNLYYSLKLGIRGRFLKCSVKNHIKPIVYLLCITISVELYTMIDTTMMTFMCDAKCIGYYSSSIKMIKMIVTVVTAVSGVLLPRLSYYLKCNDFESCKRLLTKANNVLFVLVIPSVGGIFCIADDLILIILGESFLPAALTMKLLSILIIIIGLSNLFTSQILMTYGAEKKIMFCTILGAVVNVVMNIILIPVLEQNGAAIASVIGEFIVMTMAFLCSRKYIKYKVDVSSLIKEIVGTVVMVLVIREINGAGIQVLFRLFLELIIGVTVYFTTCFLLRNMVVIDMLVSFLKINKQGE